MTYRRNQEDLLNPHRTLNRLIRDYIDGRLTNNRVFYRARVEVVDVVGGQLESIPPNPPKSIKARVYTSGLDATLPDSALTIFYPFHPQHSCPPIQVGEHVYVAFEDNQMTNGLWFVTVPSMFGSLNYSNPDEESDQTSSPSAADRFNGRESVPRQPDLRGQYGGQSFSSDTQRRVLALASQNNDSIFKDKKVLVVGDSHVNTALNSALQAALVQKGAASYFSEGRAKWSTKKWLASEGFPGVVELVDRFSPGVVVVILGTWDSFDSDYETNFSLLVNSIPSEKKIICVGPPMISGQTKAAFDALGIDRNSQLREISFAQARVAGVDNFVNLISVSGDVTITTNGLFANEEGARIWASRVSQVGQ